MKRANTAAGPGNFHLKPNGVFYVAGRTAGVMETGRYLKARVKAALLAEKGIPSLSISVDTYEGRVQLAGFVGRYGPAALAGYGVGLRLELLQPFERTRPGGTRRAGCRPRPATLPQTSRPSATRSLPIPSTDSARR